MTSSPPGSSTAASLRPASLNIPGAALYGLMVPLCALLGLCCFMGGLYGRKRRNRAVKAGPLAEEDPNEERPGQSRQPRPPSGPMERDTIQTVQWHADGASRFNSTNGRAKSANAVLSTSPYSGVWKDSPRGKDSAGKVSPAGKEAPGGKVSTGGKDSIGVKLSPGGQNSQGGKVSTGGIYSPGGNVSPGLKVSPGVQRSEADHLQLEKTQTPAEPDIRLEVEVERGGRGTSPQEEGQRYTDQRHPHVSVYTEETPYLSIGDVPPKQEADRGPGQRSRTGEVMSRVSSWPLSAAQREGKGTPGVQGEGPDIWTQNTGRQHRENKRKLGTESFWESRVYHHTPTGGVVSDSGVVSVTADTRGYSAALTSSTTDMLPLGGTSGRNTEAVSHTSPSSSQQGTTDVRVEPRRSVPSAATPGALCGKDLTVDDKTCSNPNAETLTFSLLSDETHVGPREDGHRDRGEPRPPGQRISAVGRRGPSTCRDQGAPGMGYEDLLHEVVQNRGRWTRDRWKRTHLNKQSPKQQEGEGC
ncbi:uncharacterized protein LOC132468345 [Gadus macrocephalus]|uniref:uncharacterized protein LOC132468345 n=1 Tax=Gadus macrocephalus TaxID=80720 RepID=UPI0028CB8F22|nr:uncharacterized protein LOC132468345 [Gadus macrocephalus]